VTGCAVEKTRFPAIGTPPAPGRVMSVGRETAMITANTPAVPEIWPGHCTSWGKTPPYGTPNLAEPCFGDWKPTSADRAPSKSS
jgi:hypothetical protein